MCNNLSTNIIVEMAHLLQQVYDYFLLHGINCICPMPHLSPLATAGVVAFIQMWDSGLWHINIIFLMFLDGFLFSLNIFSNGGLMTLPTCNQKSTMHEIVFISINRQSSTALPSESVQFKKTLLVFKLGKYVHSNNYTACFSPSPYNPKKKAPVFPDQWITIS